MVEDAQVVEQPQVVEQAQTQAPQAPAQTTTKKTETQKVTPTTNASQDASLNANIVAAAKSEVGTTNGQQCTEVAANALKAAGVDANQVWPDQFAQYGTITYDPQPGNLAYYDLGGRGYDHIAVYIGDGQCVHGNYWVNGTSQTVVASENVYYPGTGASVGPTYYIAIE